MGGIPEIEAGDDYEEDKNTDGKGDQQSDVGHGVVQSDERRRGSRGGSRPKHGSQVLVAQVCAVAALYGASNMMRHQVPFALEHENIYQLGNN